MYSKNQMIFAFWLRIIDKGFLIYGFFKFTIVTIYTAGPITFRNRKVTDNWKT